MRGLAGAFAAIAGVGWLDYATGPDYGVSLLYLVPVLACGWWLGLRVAAVSAIAASVAWFLADALLYGPEHLPVSLWNGITRVVIFCSMGFLISRLRIDQERLAVLNAQLQDSAAREAGLARTDPLTGLPNSRAFLETVATVAAQSRRAGLPLCVAYVDVDNLKRVNDSQGHRSGDELLCKVAGALRESLRAGDVPTRIGGDEFAVVFWDVRPQAVGEIADRLVGRVAEIARAYPDCGVGVSVGIAFFPVSPDDPEEALRRADSAMYEAKRAGKGRAVVWTDSGQPQPLATDRVFVS